LCSLSRTKLRFSEFFFVVPDNAALIIVAVRVSCRHACLHARLPIFPLSWTSTGASRRVRVSTISDSCI
jgi:hypothetical protein